jgi:hypothetical protein
MKKRAVPVILIAVTLLTGAIIAEAQQPVKVPRIGFLYAGSPSGQLARAQAFRQSTDMQRENTIAFRGSWPS